MGSYGPLKVSVKKVRITRDTLYANIISELFKKYGTNCIVRTADRGFPGRGSRDRLFSFRGAQRESLFREVRGWRRHCRKTQAGSCPSGPERMQLYFAGSLAGGERPKAASIPHSWEKSRPPGSTPVMRNAPRRINGALAAQYIQPSSFSLVGVSKNTDGV
jgi:hypothetical protein